MSNYIRLTIPPGNIDQSANTILVNASRTSIPANIQDAFFITPVRENVPGTQVLYYDTTTKEVTHGVAAPPTTAIWGVWSFEGDAGDPVGGVPGTGHFTPRDTATIPINPAATKSIAINLDDCTGPVSPLMGIAGTLSASGGYHIVIRGWDSDCSGLDVYKMQAKFAITQHKIDGGGTAAIFDVSYNNSSGVFQGGETAPLIKYYNIIIAQDIAPMGPTGAMGVTGPTGSPAIAASSVWEIAEDPSVVGPASTPVATEFNIENAGGNTETNPALVTKIDINIQDCNGVNWELLRNYGYLTGYYVVIRGWDSDCSGEDIYQVQTKYRITSTAVIADGAGGEAASLGVSYVSSFGSFEGPSKFYNIIVGADVAPMGPTGFTGATGIGGGTGPTGAPAIAASSVWMIAEDPSVGGAASTPVATEFNIENAVGNTEENPSLVTKIDINIRDCNGVFWELLRNYGYLVNFYVVIRGWDSDCSGEDIYQVQTKYYITSATYTGGVASLGVNYVSSYGIFEGPSKYYNIIVGADVAPMGPTGFTGATGTAGVTGPTGRSAIAVSATWQLGDVSGNPASDPSGTEFIPVSAGVVQVDPALTTQIRINSLDCLLDTTENTELLIPNYLTGQKLVIRGYNDDCSGTIVEKVQAEYRITDHVVFTAPPTPPSAYMEVAYISSAGNFGELKFHNIIIGADIAPIGPTGPCCTGPTGPKGPTGLPAVGAVGVWGLDENDTAPAPIALANGIFAPIDAAGNVEYDPSSVTQFRINTTDCTSMLHKDMADAGLLDGAFIVVRGWDASCSGADVYKVHAKYRLVSHTVTLTTAYYNVTYVSSAGTFSNNGSTAYHNIILGSDIAEMGPTGPCCTGSTGPTGPRGIDGVGANGVWEEAFAVGIGGIPGKGAFAPMDAGGVATADPSSCTEMLLHIDDCYDISQVHLEDDASTIGAYLVVRGYSDDCSGGEIFLMQAKYRITGHTYSLGVATLALTYMSGYGSYVEAKFYHIIVGADPAPIGPTGPTGPCCTGPTGPAGSPAIVASSRWESTTATGGVGAPGDGQWLAGDSAGQITTDPSSVAHFRINEVDCLGDIQTRLNNNDLTGLEIVVRGWDDDCSGNLAYNTFKVRSRHRITNAVYGTFLTEEIVDLSVNYLSGFGTYSTGKFYDIVIGADIVDPGPTGPCMWILDSSNNFWGPSGMSMLNGSAGEYNVICGPSCCIAGVLDGKWNTFVGAAAGGQMVSGDSNVFFGSGAGAIAATSNGNILVGSGAGSEAQTLGLDNVFIGTGAGLNAPDSSANIGIGCKAAANALLLGASGGETASYNINIGYMNGSWGVSGAGNIGIGYECPLGVVGNQNIEIGTGGGSGLERYVDNTIILNASGTGFDASSNAFYVNPLRSATQSNVLYYNTATKEITYNTSEAAADISGVWTHDSSNNFYGPSGAALALGIMGNQGTGNTFGGVQVVTSVGFSGSNNTAFGYEAFMLATQADENVAIGAQALKSADTSGANTAVGFQALSLATSENNTAVGNAAAINLTTGGNNTIMGTCAGEGLTTGSNNLVLGYQAFASANGDTSGCICLNATGGDFSPAGTLSSQLFVKPIRSATAAQALYYNATTGEITYNTSAAAADVSGAWTFDSSNNFYGPSGEAGSAGFDGEGNIAVGDGALNAFVVTGDFNVAVGTDALRDNSGGFHNVAVGRQAMLVNTDGGENTALGYQALAVNTTGNQNVAIGDDALLFNATGNSNIAVGFGAMGGPHAEVVSSHENIAIGREALFDLRGGHNNIAIGLEALRLQRDTSSNIAIGRQAMGGYMRSGSENVAIGHHALRDVSGGFANVALGYKAAAGNGSNFDISGSIFIGYRAGDGQGGVGDGNSNIVIGYEAAGPTNSDVMTGDHNILIGTQARPGQSGTDQILIGRLASGAGANAGNCIVLNASGSELEAAGNNTFTVKPIRSAIASQTLYYDPTSGEITYNTSAAAADVSGAWTFDSSNNFYGPSGEAGSAGFDGEGNIAVGDGALNAFVVTGDFNVAVGTDALRDNTSGEHNVAVGRQAMLVNTDGDENTALGYQALAVNTSGNQNVAIGDDALLFNATGNSNIAVGFGAMGGNHAEVSSSHENIAIGREALFDLRGGHNNIAIGFEALRFQRDTSSNIAIGRQAMGGLMQSGSENVAIGHNALLNVDNGFANVAVGYHAGRGGGGGGGSFDVSGSIFIGYKAGDSLGGPPTGTANIVIGYEAGATSDVLSGENNILIGTKTAPGQSGDHQVLIGEQASGSSANVGNCIVLNATGSTLGATADNTFFVKPIRRDSDVPGFVDASGLVYDPTTGEIICSTTKTFVIPYPGQPGKVLRHACVEAPTRGTNIYEYQINVTETNKTTSIDLPPYFKDLNSRPRVYVSPTRGFNCGGCGGYVNEDLTAVIVETEKPGTFNIMVTGIRKDPGAIAYSATEMIDEPTIMEDVPPSTTHTICSTQ